MPEGVRTVILVVATIMLIEVGILLQFIFWDMFVEWKNGLLWERPLKRKKEHKARLSAKRGYKDGDDGNEDRSD